MNVFFPFDYDEFQWNDRSSYEMSFPVYSQGCFQLRYLSGKRKAPESGDNIATITCSMQKVLISNSYSHNPFPAFIFCLLIVTSTSHSQFLFLQVAMCAANVCQRHKGNCQDFATFFLVAVGVPMDKVTPTQMDYFSQSCRAAVGGVIDAVTGHSGFWHHFLSIFNPRKSAEEVQ